MGDDDGVGLAKLVDASDADPNSGAPSNGGHTMSTNSAGKPKTPFSKPPEAMKAPKTPDDLKLISGVGPKLEGVLNGLGIYKFKQIAAWSKDEIDWVDDHLKFKGRIERDDWIKQADALDRGGEAEYIRVFGKKPR